MNEAEVLREKCSATATAYIVRESILGEVYRFVDYDFVGIV